MQGDVADQAAVEGLVATAAREFGRLDIAVSNAAYSDRELFYEAALISLDLAAVYVKLQAEPELKQTVAETVPIFRSLGVKRELLGSLLQLQQPPSQSRQTLAMLQVLSSRIEQLPAQSIMR